MQRTAMRVTVLFASILVLSGCRSNKKTEANYDVGYDAGAAAYDPYTSPTYRSARSAEAPAADAYDYNSGVQLAATSPAAVDPYTGSRSHVIAKGDTLYGLARMYYNDVARWKDIYEANRPSITDPNRIRIGQKLVIP